MGSISYKKHEMDILVSFRSRKLNILMSFYFELRNPHHPLNIPIPTPAPAPLLRDTSDLGGHEWSGRFGNPPFSIGNHRDIPAFSIGLSEIYKKV